MILKKIDHLYQVNYSVNSFFHHEILSANKQFSSVFFKPLTTLLI